MNLYSCKDCERLSSNLIKLKSIYPTYHCLPVKGFGKLTSELCIVGLAPGLHGANKTGIPFTDDFSGNVIRQVLNNYDESKIYITNVVKCYPPMNKPKLSEINLCKKYFSNELRLLKNLRVIVTLGSIAYYETIRYFDLTKKNYNFKHGKIINLNNNQTIISSFHCSKLNFNTKRISITMLNNIFKKAFKIVNDG